MRDVDRSAWPETTVVETMEPLGEFQTCSAPDPMPEVVEKVTAGGANRVHPPDLTRFIEGSQRLGLIEARL